MKRASGFILLLGITALMAGCKLAVIVVEGGEVQSDANGTCMAGLICIVEVTDANFSETFTAVPAEGWYFAKWNSGDRFFCGGSTDPRCPLSSQGHEESKAVEDMVASSEVFYIMPVFKQFTDTVTVDGKEWLQPKDFINYSYNEVSAVCPAGACSGSLPGSTFDLTGYTWASIDDMDSLFNAYGNVGNAILEDFAYISKDKSTLILASMVRDPNPEKSKIYIALVVGGESDDPEIADSAYEPAHSPSEARPDTGIWFWR